MIFMENDQKKKNDLKYMVARTPNFQKKKLYPLGSLERCTRVNENYVGAL